MTATKDDISQWFDDGVKQGATHMIVVCDTFDWEDYPAYVKPGQDARVEFNLRNGPNMTKGMECYALWKPKEHQLNQRRTFDFDKPPEVTP